MREIHELCVKITHCSAGAEVFSEENGRGIADALGNTMRQNVKSKKTLRLSRKEAGFTFWDLATVLAAVVLGAAWSLQWLARPKRCGGINCVSNLKQVGLGFRMWANDHDDRFPWQVSTSDGGTLELAGTAEAWRHFAVVSNEFSSPKILVCPEDRGRTRAGAWSAGSAWPCFSGNNNLSYFVGLNAVEGSPQTLLSGDRTLTTNGRIATGFLTLSSNSPVSWVRGLLHNGVGNIGLADGSAQQVNEAMLRKEMQRLTNWPVQLVVP